MKKHFYKTILLCIISLVSLNMNAQGKCADCETKKEVKAAQKEAKQEAKEAKKEEKEAEKGITNKKDSCDFNNFTIDETNLTINNEKGLLGVYISMSLDEKKGEAKQVFIILKMINCKGEEQFVKVELFYNKTSGNWEGKQAILQNTDCNWTIVSTQYLVLNFCDEAYYSDAIDMPEAGNPKSLTKQARRVKIHK
jgi:hypothetical protein